MVDIAPTLYEDIEKSFTKEMIKDTKIKAVSNRIRDGTATQIDGRIYAEEVGKNLSNALQKKLKPENLPNGKLYYNIAERTIKPALKTNYDLVNDIASDIQEIEDAIQGIGIKSVKADYPDLRIDGLIDKITQDDITFEKILYWINEPIINNTEAFFDDFIKENAKFRQEIGLKSTVSRILAPGCCDWCTDAAGKGAYIYGEEPEDFYRRHEYCRCTVTYRTERTSQNVWTKAVWQSRPEEITERQNIINEALKGLSKDKAEIIKANINTITNRR